MIDINKIAKTFIAIIVVVPLIVGVLTIIPNSFINTSNDWIGFFGSYIGSIIGGLISGGLTLAGVLLTIRKTDKDRFNETYNNQKILIDEAIQNIKRTVINLGLESHDPMIIINSLKQISAGISEDIDRLKGTIDYSTYKVVSLYIQRLKNIEAEFNATYRKEADMDFATRHMNYALGILKALETYATELDQKLVKINKPIWESK